MKKKNKKSSKEKVLSQIILKYYKKPTKSLDEKPSGIMCAYCFERNIVDIGGGFKDDKGKLYQICERCAMWQYRKENRFRTLAAARARRRRIFDIGYLFNEMIIDKYMELKGIKNFNSLDANVADKLFIDAVNLFNYLFSKEDKVRIEEMEYQTNIETELRNRFDIIDFQKYFRKLGLFEI